MAQIKITDATVAFLNSKGFTAKAQVMVLGEMRDEYYKIWTDENSVKVMSLRLSATYLLA